MYMRRKQSEKGCLFLSVFLGTYVQTGTGCRLVSPPDLSEAYSDSGQFQFLARIYFIHIINSVQFTDFFRFLWRAINFSADSFHLNPPGF